MLIITSRLSSLTLFRINKVKNKLIKAGQRPEQCDTIIATMVCDIIGLQQGYRSYAKLSHRSKFLGPLFILYKSVFDKLHEYRLFNIYEALFKIEINGDMLIIYLR